jgi:ketosteroid isomerase-like protein
VKEAKWLIPKQRRLVTQFWAAMQANDWAAATALFADDYVLYWPQSGEHIHEAS